MTTTTEIKCIHELWHDGSEEKIRAILYDDGAINSCSLDSEGAENCCFTSQPDQEEAYWAFLDHLTNERGYMIRDVEAHEVQLLERKKPCIECGALEPFKRYLERRRQVARHKELLKREANNEK